MLHGWCVAPVRAEGLEARGRRARLGKECEQVRAQAAAAAAPRRQVRSSREHEGAEAVSRFAIT